jgi:hypothetical protein
MPLPEFLTDPVPLAVLTLVIFAVVQYQRTLSWTEYRQIHRLKRRFFPLLDRVWPHFVHDKNAVDDPEYLTTRPQKPRTVWKQLVSEGASPHVIASLKRREWPDGVVDYSVAHAVWTHADGTQTEAYLFRAPTGTDVYVHNETAVTDADGHLSDPQTDGDPKGVVKRALGIEADA